MYTLKVDLIERLRSCVGFEWDEGNAEKSAVKHRVSRFEAEEVFFNHPLVVTDDEAHSVHEERFFALGQTGRRRPLFVVFAIRGQLIRVISARDMTRKEREVYRAHG